MTADADRIERDVTIAASAQRVWELIRTPGWWINEGSIVEVVYDATSDVNVIWHPQYGGFRVQTVTLDEPRHAAFRWLAGEGDDELSPEGGTSTLVEFWIDERSDGVTLRVVESGFGLLPVSDEQRRKTIDGNTEGWEIELAAAVDWVERAEPFKPE
ncbi:SRPBCC family protein [Rathayibacter soli]|uniref:ATPase n=1 Tax=Rathayibacter soli TaxID=3144168 RepID=UPI0027E3BDE7|nr:ATPase [Glaciibacter superstes]